MKLKLEVFKEVAILKVNEQLTCAEIDLLRVGFRRITTLKIKWIIVNLIDAHFDETVVAYFLKFKNEFEKDLKELLLVGTSQILCPYKTLHDALLQCERTGSTETRFLTEKVELEDTLKELELKKQMISRPELTELTDEQKNHEIQKLRREAFRLKNLQSFLINDIVREAFNRKEASEFESVETESRLTQLLCDMKLLTHQGVA